MSELPRFGASDFWLVETDAAQLRESLRSALSSLLGRSVADSDPHMVLASAFLPYLVQGQASADACAKATLRAFAVGQDLDRIADATCVVGYLDRNAAQSSVLPVLMQFTVTRPLAVAETVTVSWEATRGIDDVVFSGSGEFTVTFDLEDAEAKSFAVPVYLTCSETGAAYNGLAEDTDSVIEDAELTQSAQITAGAYTVGSISLAICGATYNGSDAESDENFAIRSLWQAKALRVPGSLEYFRLELSKLHLLASSYVSPTVDSAGRIVMAWSDKVHFVAASAGVTLSVRGAAVDEFFTAVRSSLLVEQRAYAYPAVQHSTASPFITVYYALPADASDQQALQSSIEEAFRRYVSDHAWHCGATIRLSDIDAVFVAAGAESVWPYSHYVPTQGLVLPADAILLASQFRLVKSSVSVSSDPVGGSGEEVTP